MGLPDRGGADESKEAIESKRLADESPFEEATRRCASGASVKEARDLSRSGTRGAFRRILHLPVSVLGYVEQIAVWIHSPVFGEGRLRRPDGGRGQTRRNDLLFDGARILDLNAEMIDARGRFLRPALQKRKREIAVRHVIAGAAVVQQFEPEHFLIEFSETGRVRGLNRDMSNLRHWFPPTLLSRFAPAY